VRETSWAIADVCELERVDAFVECRSRYMQDVGQDTVSVDAQEP